MNEHIYIDKGRPVISLEPEILSDGSKAFNIHLRESLLAFTSEQKARDAMALIAKVLREGTCHNVLHL